jgi:hypothetical protein
MRVFLNQVMLDHETESANFQIALMLGNGNRVVVPSLMHVHADMTEDYLATFLTEHEGELVRQELAGSAFNTRPIAQPTMVATSELSGRSYWRA